MKYLFVLLVFIFVGCSSNPLGIPDDMWLNMNEEQKLQAYEQQAQINLQKEQNRQKELELRAKEEQKQQELLEYKKANASYGERVQCIVFDAKANLNKNLRTIESFGIDLLKGDITKFSINQDTSSSRKYHTYGYARFDGQIVKLCTDSNLSSNRCVSVIGTHMDFAKGIETIVNNDKFLVGKIKCEFVPINGNYIIIK